MNTALNIDDLRLAARRHLPKTIFEFIDGGAQDEITLRRNRADFERHAFMPRVMTDITARDLSTTVLGTPLAFPIVMAPTGLAGVVRRRGELAASRAAATAGIPCCLSMMSTCTIEQIAEASPVDRWFQLYVLRDRGITKAMIERARASGCKALVLTVDTKLQGPRERDMRNGFTVPPKFTLRTMVDQIAFMERLLDLDGMEQRIEHYVHVVEPAVAKDADKVFLLLREALLRGQFARGEAGRIVGASERTGRDLLSRAIAAGLLTSESPKTPVSLALPAKVLDSYFPQLFPLTSITQN